MKLGYKIVLTSSTIILAMGLLILGALQVIVKATLKNYLVNRGIFVTQTVAESLLNSYLDKNLLVIDRYLSSVKQRTFDLEYAYLIDPHQQILLSTFEQGFPVELLYRTLLPKEQTIQVLLLKTEAGYIRDVGIKLLPGLSAELHLGFSEETVRRSVERVGVIISLITLGGVIVFGAAAFTLSHHITRPLEELSTMATRIGNGDLNWEINVRSCDEVGQLAESFNQMTARLRETIERLKESEAELKRREELMGQLLAKALHAQEEERKRIARELHDETSQSLAALVLNLKAAATVAQSDPQRAQRILEELKEAASNIIKELHNIVYDLRPTLLDDHGLIPALAWYAENKLKPQGVKIHIDVSGDLTELPLEAETILYRIGQEAISNVYRHAEAQNLWLSLKVLPYEAVMTIRDDGKGFDVQAVFSGQKTPLGLLGMQERAALFNGQVNFQSYPGHGTLVVATLPLTHSTKPSC